MKELINIKNISGGWLTTILGVIIMAWAVWKHETDWNQTFLGLGGGLFLFFIPDPKNENMGIRSIVGAILLLLLLVTLLLVGCGAKAPTADHEWPQVEAQTPDSMAGPVRLKKPGWALFHVNVYKDKSTTVNQTGKNNSTGKEAKTSSVEGEGNIQADGQVKNSNQDRSKTKDAVRVDRTQGNVDVDQEQKESAGISYAWLILLVLAAVGYFAFRHRKKLGSPL